MGWPLAPYSMPAAGPSENWANLPMHKLRWNKSDYHPPLEWILLFVEGELDKKTGKRLVQHLSECWTCRASAEDVKQGIRTFIEFHEMVLVPSVPLDPRTSGIRR